MKTKTRKRKRGLQQDKVNFNEGVKLWASYYRCNMHRFATDYLQLPLFGFQMILLYMMNINNFFYFVASRGKLFLAPLCRNIQREKLR